MISLNAEQAKAIVLLAQAFVDTVRDMHPEPCPGGVMYAAFNSAGGSLAQFQQIMDALVRVGRLKRAPFHSYVLGPEELLRVVRGRQI